MNLSENTSKTYRLEEITTINMRPAPRLPKIIALSMILWEMAKRHIPLPEVSFVPESLQRKGPGIYNLDCAGNGYRERGYPGECETVVDDFPEIELYPELDCLAELVMSHNVPEPRVQGKNGGVQRSTHFKLNTSRGSLGFFTGQAWEIIAEVSAAKWKTVVQAEDGAILSGTRASKVLTPQDFLQMCLHVINTFVKAEQSRRTEGSNWNSGMQNKVVKNLLAIEFQGQKLGNGLNAPLTLARYIRDLWQTGHAEKEISDLLAPWLTLWVTIERQIEDALNLKPHYRFTFGKRAGAEGRGICFDFTATDDSGYPEGFDNPAIHTAWLGNDENGNPRANVVVIRKPSGLTAIMMRDVDWDSIRALAAELADIEPDCWTQIAGGIYNGSNSRVDHKRSKIPVIGGTGQTIPRLAELYLRPVIRREIPQRKYASGR